MRLSLSLPPFLSLVWSGIDYVFVTYLLVPYIRSELGNDGITPAIQRSWKHGHVGPTVVPAFGTMINEPRDATLVEKMKKCDTNRDTL